MRYAVAAAMMKTSLLIVFCLVLGLVLSSSSEHGDESRGARKRQSREELRAHNEKITAERRETQFLHKTHKLLVEQGRHAEASKIDLQIKARKQRLNNDIAAQSGLSEAYLKYKSSQRKAHPFASTGADKKSRLEWEAERHADMKAAIRSKCDAFLAALETQPAPSEPASEEAASPAALAPWREKIERYYALHCALYDHHLAVSRTFEATKELRDKAARGAFLAEQRALRDGRKAVEAGLYADIAALHAELRGRLGAAVTGQEAAAGVERVRGRDEL